MKNMRKGKQKVNKYFFETSIVIALVISALFGAYWFWGSSPKVEQAAPIAPEPKVEISLPFSGEYKDVENKFTITPPNNWLMKNKNIGSASVQFINPVADEDATGKFSANINVLVEPTSLSVEDYAKASEETLSKLLSKYKLIDFKKKTFGGLSGYIVGGTFENNGIALRNRQIFVVSKGNVYIATAISLNSLWNKYVEDFNASLYGLKVK